MAKTACPVAELRCAADQLLLMIDTNPAALIGKGDQLAAAISELMQPAQHAINTTSEDWR